ncbi:MAG: hypothetical protein HYV37_00445 [Candidatus Levyibacteriota bacterium]|nr:MAG: hypothetical protein HYV37_00445 [Candidatus Levybacteria bacterium]
MLEIIPGILEKTWEEAEKKIEMLSPFAKVMHIDLLDGKFAPNTTFLDPKPFKKYSKDIFFELHMMVEEPVQYLKPFADAGFRRFLGHVEKMSDQAEFVAQGQLLGEVGLAIDGKTTIDDIKVPYDDLDCLLVMTINAGFSGQQFMPKHLEKVKALRSKIQNQFFPIEVDGGVNDLTIVQAKNAGANRFVATSFLFGQENPQKQFQALSHRIAV